MAGADVKEFKVLGLNLWQQVLAGLLLGVAVGFYFKETAVDLKVMGTVFINLIKMVVVPLIFFALLSGMTSMGDQKNFTRVGLKATAAYLLTSIFAVILGLVMANLLNPGIGLQVDLSTFSGTTGMEDRQPPAIGEFLLSLIPTNALRAMTEDHYIQVVIFSIFTGITMNLMGDQANKAREIIGEIAKINFKMIELIVRLAPLAVFGFTAWSVSTLGLEIFISLGNLVIAVLVACLVQYLIFGLLILVFGRMSPLPFYRKIFTTQLMAFSTSSSKATLTTAMREVQQKMGASEQNTNFVLPLGACINMDGTAIYLGICAVFFAQMFGIELGLHEYLMLILTCTLGSIGAAGIPSGSIIFMSMVLHSVGLPIEGIALLLGIDRILDMVRTTINITGDAAITVIIDRSEKKLNETQYHA